MKLLKIKELMIDETDDFTGVEAVSFVDYPAIEEDFIYFAVNKRIIKTPEDITEQDLDVKYKWILGRDENGAEPCPACIKWSQESPKKLKTWITTALPRVRVGTKIGLLTSTGDHEPYNTFCEDKCRCHLEAVQDTKTKMSFDFKIENELKKEVVGAVMISNKLIYRHDIGGSSGYVWFSNETIRKIYNKYGYNKTITIHHTNEKKSNSVILMKSWLDEAENSIKWMMRFKIIDSKLWENILNGSVKGFSIEGRFIGK